MKYQLYYTLNKKLDFELTTENEKEIVEKINLMSTENMEIIFHLIFEYLRNKNNLFNLDFDKQSDIILDFLGIRGKDNQDQIYKLNFSDFDLELKKILWKFLNNIPKKI